MTLKAEQEEYEMEGIEVIHYSPRFCFFEQPPHALLFFINEEGILPVSIAMFPWAMWKAVL